MLVKKAPPFMYLMLKKFPKTLKSFKNTIFKIHMLEVFSRKVTTKKTSKTLIFEIHTLEVFSRKVNIGNL